MMNKLFPILSLLLPGLFFTSCDKEDDYVYPPVTTELLCVKTTPEGKLHSIITDYGNIYIAANGDQVSGLQPDTIYRMQCIYDAVTPEENGVVDLYSLRLIGSWIPVEIQEKKTDPVDIESIWLSGNYINFSAMVKVQDSSKHTYHFVYEGIGPGEEGTHTLSLSFYHDRGDDVEGYTQRLYFSVPLYEYDIDLNSGDKISFTVNTYKKGLRIWYFPEEL